MRKTKAKHEADIVKCIKENKITYISHIFGYYADLEMAQFYNLKLEKSETIKRAIEENKVKAKNYLRNKWIASENPTLQIAAYRLMADEEERAALNQQEIKHSGKVGVEQTIINFNEVENNAD